MKKLSNNIKRLITLLLCIAIVLGISINVTRAEEQTALSASGKSTEVLALRQENEKHFSMGNGTYQAITYGHPVHELDSDGNWQDIDFSLTLSGTRGNRKYTNESATASFPEQYTANQPILTLGEKDHTIAMALLPAEKDGAANRAAITAEVTNPQNSFRTLEEAKNANFASTVLYKNVLPGVDLEYIVDPGTVKENIIVKEKTSSYRYTFSLNTTGLYPTLLKDGSILVRDQETDTKKYEIPAPFMYDALGNLSEEVTYTLLGNGNSYTLTIIANADWINAKGRSFPVTIDFTSAKANSPGGTRDLGVEDTYIDADDPNVAHGFRNWLWVRSNRTTYIKIPTPNLPENAYIEQAELTAYYYYFEYVTSGAVNVSAHRVNGGNWNEDELTWNGIANLSNYGLISTALDTITAAAANAKINNPGKADFEITSTFRNWVEGDIPNYGIGLKYAAGSSNLSVLFMSSESGYNYCPRFAYQYTDVIFLTNYYDSSLSDDLANIAEAIAFANDAFYKQFGIRILNYGISPVTQDVIEFCDDNCPSACPDHHKEVLYISDQLLELEDKDNPNDRIVYWTDRGSGGYYCTHDNPQGDCKDYQGSIALVIDNRPVIHFLDIVPDSGDDKRLACMALTLLHEMAHTYGLPDMYDNPDVPEPAIHSQEGMQCVMEMYSSTAEGGSYPIIFYEAISNGTNAFCDSCADWLADLIGS